MDFELYNQPNSHTYNDKIHKKKKLIRIRQRQYSLATFEIARFITAQRKRKRNE